VVSQLTGAGVVYTFGSHTDYPDLRDCQRKAAVADKAVFQHQDHDVVRQARRRAGKSAVLLCGGQHHSNRKVDDHHRLPSHQGDLRPVRLTVSVDHFPVPETQERTTETRSYPAGQTVTFVRLWQAVLEVDSH
jgi:hypothetical protein